MKRKKVLFTGLALGLSLPLAMAQQPAQNEVDRANQPGQPRQVQPGQPGQPGKPYRDPSLEGREHSTKASYFQASEIIGQKVKNQQGEDIGEIKDVIFDLNSGRAPVVVLGYGGTLGVGATRVAVPMNHLHSTGQNQLSINLTKEQLETASKRATGPWEGVAKEGWTRQVNRFYGQPDWGMRSFDRELDRESQRQPVRDPQNPNLRRDQQPKPNQPNQPNKSDPTPFDNEGKGAPQLSDPEKP